jgi:hypothetical protein
VLIAWGDESGSDRRLDPGTYILGAVITDGIEAENQARERLQTLRLPGQKKTHWKDESDKRRDEIIEALGECGLDGIVVARVGPLDERDERRRRKCFKHFANTLYESGIQQLCLESRGVAADKRDQKLVVGLKSALAIPSAFRLEHARGNTDPLLWAADAVCGAVVSARIGNLRWWRKIERTVRSESFGWPR